MLDLQDLQRNHKNSHTNLAKTSVGLRFRFQSEGETNPAKAASAFAADVSPSETKLNDVPGYFSVCTRKMLYLIIVQCAWDS